MQEFLVRLTPEARGLVEVRRRFLDLGATAKDMQDAQRKALVASKGDTRQVQAAACADENLAAAIKLLDSKAWRTKEGASTSHNPALDAKSGPGQGVVTIYMEIEGRGYAWHLDWDDDQKTTVGHLIQRVDQQMEQAGIWRLPSLGSRDKWGPTVLSLGGWPLDAQATMEGQGIPSGCLLYATHLRQRKRKARS